MKIEFRDDPVDRIPAPALATFAFEGSPAASGTVDQLPAETRRYFIIRCIIDSQVRDAVRTSEAAILASGVQTADEVRRQARPLVRHSPARQSLNEELNRYLHRHLYDNPAVAQPNRRAGAMLEDLFAYYAAHPGEIGESSRQRAPKTGWPRAICDYLSGMTDRYTILEHQRLLGLQMGD